MTLTRFKHSYHPYRVSTAMTEEALVPKQRNFRCKSFTSRYLYQVNEFLKQANGKSFFSLASLDIFELPSMEEKTKQTNNKQAGKPKIPLVFTDTFRSRIILQKWLFQLLRKPAQVSNNRKNTQGHRQALFGEKLPSDYSDKLCKVEPCIADEMTGISLNQIANYEHCT